jgi:hypothetical protein
MEHTAMRLGADGSTSPTLLNEISNRQEHPAWVTFRGRYDPLLRRCCGGYGLDDDSVDEVCQRIWIELADRMRTFDYDPNRSFRSRLSRVCESRVVDFPRQRQAVCLLGLLLIGGFDLQPSIRLIGMRKLRSIPSVKIAKTGKKADSPTEPRGEEG